MQLSASLLGLTAAVTFISGGKTLTPPKTTPPPPSTAQTSSVSPLALEVLKLVNAERTSRKLQPLTLNAKLTTAAQIHADDMVSRKYFSHLSPEGKTAEDRIAVTGYFTVNCVCSTRKAYGENLAKGQQTAVKVMADWMKSPVHQSNILKSSFREMGLAHKDGIWVQTFGTMEVLK